MRRKDREVTDFNEIVKIIDQCNVVRIGLSDGEFPYIVPVNFGYTVSGEHIYLYIHGAMAGRKYEMLSANPNCSFEMDIPVKIDCMPEKKAVTMRYKSVMGKAKAVFLDGEARLSAIDTIMNRFADTRNFDYDKSPIPNTAVIRLDVTEITAKSNVSPNSAEL